jgi:DNA gyrase/topoisomerase IV subunit B
MDDDYDSRWIRPLRGLEAVRRRPGMYIGVDEAGRESRARLLEALIESMVRDVAFPPQEIRLLMWQHGVTTVAHDDGSVSIAPFCATPDGVPHPALYHLFLHLGVAPFQQIIPFGPILNALSEELAVSTMHDGRCYRAVFSRGMIVTLLRCVSCDRPLGTTWLTFRPDPTILGGEPLATSDAEKIAERMRSKAGNVRILVEDRTGEDADWH